MSKPPLGAPIDRIPVHKVSPVIEGGAYPAKAVVGESIPIRATVFREGHDAVNASVVLTDPNGNERLEPMHPTTCRVRLVDSFGGARHRRSMDVPSRRLERSLGDLGAQRRDQDPRRNRCFPHVHRRHLRCLKHPPTTRRQPATPQSAGLLRGAAKSLDSGQQVDRLEVVLAEDVRAAMRRYGPRELVSPTPEYPIFVDRRAALFGSWYEFFPDPRVRGGTREPDVDIRHVRHLTRAPRGCGCNGLRCVYLPPIHPIGRSFRKGPNNTLNPGPADPGSPWAIGAAEGGHDAIHPDLGDFDSFDRFVAKAKSLGLEVAMDFALQRRRTTRG